MAAVVAAAGSYLAAAKKMSGTVKSSDAEQLWAESRSIREWSTERIAELSGTVQSLENRVRNLETDKTDLLQEKHDLLETIERLSAELAESRITVHELRAELEQARTRIQELEKEANGGRQGA